MHASAQRLLAHLSRNLAPFLPGTLCQPLCAARLELHQNLRLAFRLASTQQRPIVLQPGQASGTDGLTMRLPEGVRWGRPKTVPLPPSLADSGWRSGRPRPITVMPRRRATANVWFLHHGRQALCLRLSLAGAVELLRYRPVLRTWVAC